MTRWRRFFVLAISLLALGGSEAAVAGSLPAPGVFELDASNGYSIVAMGLPPRRGKAGSVIVILQKPGASVVYLAPAEVTASSIRAQLGGLGEIDVDFQPSGRRVVARSSCEGEPVAVDSGFYAGTVDFTGEEGYAEADATRARGAPRFALSLLCPNLVGPSGTGPGLPGAELRLRSGSRDSSLVFVAHENRPGARAFFGASLSERRGDIGITRSVGVRTRSDAFEYDLSMYTATVEPPLPFAGSATFRGRAQADSRLTGTLSVDFPGHSDADIAAGALRANLVRAQWDNDPQR